MCCFKGDLVEYYTLGYRNEYNISQDSKDYSYSLIPRLIHNFSMLKRLGNPGTRLTKDYQYALDYLQSHHNYQ